MSAFPTINPVTHLDGKGLVNPDSSGVASFLTTSRTIPSGPHTLPPAGSNVQSAAAIYQGGKRINRKKINKISRKYKMKGSRRTIRRRVRRIKSRVRSKHARRSRRNKSKSMRGGMAAPVYPAGHSQYMNNNGSISNTYSLGGPLSAGSSALANPPTFSKVENAVVPDNLNRNALNSYGNRVGAGFASRGWF